MKTPSFGREEIAVRLAHLDYVQVRQICQDVIAGKSRFYDLEVIVPQNWDRPHALATYWKGHFSGTILLKDRPTSVSHEALVHELGHHFDPFLYGEVASSEKGLPWAERDVECWAEAVAMAYTWWQPVKQDRWTGMGEAYYTYLPLIRAHFASQRAASTQAAPRPHRGLRSNARRLRQEWEAGRDEF